MHPTGSVQQVHIQIGDALVIVDVQNDFLTTGSLAVPGAEAIIPVLNRYIKTFTSRHLTIVATRDWHPTRHSSFKECGGPWPAHCVQGTEGANFYSALNLPSEALVISKGDDPTRDAYSGFQETDLSKRLKVKRISRLFIGGLATDYCVLHTVKDAREAGFDVYLLEDAVRAVNVKPDDGTKAGKEMVRVGALPIRIDHLV